MEILDYVWYAVCALIGLMIHTLAKMRSLDKKARAAKEEFKVSQYLWDEKFTFSISLLSIAFVIIILPEIININPKVMGIELVNFVRISFGLIGYVSNDGLVRLFGVSSKKINSTIEDKLK